MYEIKKMSDGKISVGLPVEWAMAGEVPVTFDSKEDFEAALSNYSFEKSLNLPKEGQYIDGSFQINREFLEDMKRHEFGDK